MRRAPAALLAAAVLAVPISATAVHAAAPRTTATVTATQTWPHRLAPQLFTDVSGDQVVVMGVPDGSGGLSRIVSTTRSPGGAWAPETTLAGPQSGLSEPTVGTSDNGHAAVVWTTGLGGGIHVRVLGAAGTWGATQVFKPIKVYGTPQVVVNADGDVAIAADELSGSDHVAVLRDGIWTVTECPGFSTPAVGLDADGVLYAVSTSEDHGGLGTAYEQRFGLDQKWTPLRQLRGISPMIQDTQLLVSPAGHLTIALGYASRHWLSTYDGDAYFTTAYAVLQQDDWSKPPSIVWRKDGADWLQLDAARHGALWLTWTQWADKVKRKPTRVGLHLQRLGGPVLDLASQPARWTHGGYDVQTVLAPHSRAVTWWRAYAPHTALSAPLQVAVSTPKAAGAPSTALDTAVRWSSLSLNGGYAAGELAWNASVTYRNTKAYGWVERDGSVAVGSVPS
jgi:hypothetical protein